jgi:hypothetical protein
MFATLCSNPAATKAAMGRHYRQNLVRQVRAPYVSQTARQTSALQNAPRAIRLQKSKIHLAGRDHQRCPIDLAVAKRVLARQVHEAGGATAPTKLPR